MIIRWRRFNIYLLLAVSAVLLCGCRSAESKRKKQISTLRLHGEMNRDVTGRSEKIQIYRAQPVPLTVDKVPFVDEANVKEAKVIDALGGFALQIQFDRRGSWLLEQFSAALRDRHIAVFSQFVKPPAEKPEEARWLAAPLVTQAISNGLLVFTPDASREEAEQIALGLNNVAKKHKDEPGR
jgi:hypothetical protein